METSKKILKVDSSSGTVKVTVKHNSSHQLLSAQFLLISNYIFFKIYISYTMCMKGEKLNHYKWDVFQVCW